MEFVMVPVFGYSELLARMFRANSFFIQSPLQQFGQ